MKIIVIFFCMFFTMSCKKNINCEIDADFKRQFDKNIEYLIASETDTSFLYQPTDKIKVIYFFESISGMKSQIYWSDALIYPDRKTLKEDLEKWNDWYEDNKCKMTIEKADSLLDNYSR